MERKLDMKKLIALVGTNSDESTNRKLLEYMAKHFGKEASIELMEIKGLPLFNKPKTYTVLPEIQKMADKIEQSDGVIISTPEYDHSITASLSNALAWLSYGIYPFVDKPVMIVGASYGTLGSSRAQMHLRQILDAPELKARTMPSNEFLLGQSLAAFDAEGELVYTEKVKELESIFNEFMVFMNLIEQLPTDHAAHKKAAQNFSWETI